MGKIGEMNAQIGEMKAQMNELRGMMKQMLENKNPGTVDGKSVTYESVSTDDSGLKAIFEAFVKTLQDEGYISKKPLDQRNAANYNAALTPDEAPASISGPVTALFGLRKLKEKISANNFVAALPNLSAVAAAAGAAVGAAAPNDSWNVADVNTVRNEYKKLSDVIDELRSLMASVQF